MNRNLDQKIKSENFTGEEHVFSREGLASEEKNRAQRIDGRALVERASVLFGVHHGVASQRPFLRGVGSSQRQVRGRLVHRQQPA